jgi:pyruvate-ferredoxin/flavodoxin oxidoreductase
MAYGNVYIAHIAFGAKDAQTLKAFAEAESYSGPSLIIAFSHCIAHGYDMARALDQQKLAVDSAYWPLFRYDPRRVAQGENPLQLDSTAARSKVGQYMQNEARFRMVEQQNPDRYRQLVDLAQEGVTQRYELYQSLAKANSKVTPATVQTPAATSSE